MNNQPKLFLYSMAVTRSQLAELTRLVGKKPSQISCAIIENAADIVPGSDTWLEGFRKPLRDAGYQMEFIDLRHWNDRHEALRDKLSASDILWVGGGHIYYLRWILKKTGADAIISDLVRQGAVYAGWSAGAVVAGPTLQYFDRMGDVPADAPEVVLDGLGLLPVVPVPHRNHPDFAESAAQVGNNLRSRALHPCCLATQKCL